MLNQNYHAYAIQADEDKGLYCREDILSKIDSLIQYYESIHCKVFIMRMDVRYPSASNPPKDNILFIQFISHLTKHLSRQGLDPKYVWVREQSREKHQHYHVAFLLNGNLIQSPHKVFNKAEELWARALKLETAKGLIHYCNKRRSGESCTNSYMLRRGAKDYEKVKGEAFYRLSYLAKENTKGNAPRRNREYSTSRTKPHSKNLSDNV